MAKKLLAMLLAAMMLLGVFAVGVTATNDSPVMNEGPQAVFGDPALDRVPNGINNRYNRYRDIARNIGGTRGAAIRLELTTVAGRFLPDVARAETQLQLNQVLNQRNNAMANVLRSHGELNVFSAFFSWVGGNFWWLWAPMLAAVVAVGALLLWEPVIAPLLG